MKLIRSIMLLSVLSVLLSACGGHRITYSGHEESTEGVPGFVNGKKVSPNVKLGQSYTVDGDTYVPRFQPDYVEEGMASWYGPGFHGGKTANGEEFDKHSMTAAHRTLPLPSIVKVTMLSSGKSVYVRINDRGPYAHGRIIDLSYGAAQEIGLIGKGTAKVRVEYDLAASQRFADLLADGRSPESIDIANDVLPYAQQKTQLASVEAAKAQQSKPNSKNSSFLDHLNPFVSANASEMEAPATTIPDEVQSSDLDAPAVANTSPAPSPAVTIQPRGDPPPTIPINQAPPPAALVQEPAPGPRTIVQAPESPETIGTGVVVPTNGGGVYIQLGSFSIQDNAAHLQQKVANIGTASVIPTPSGSVMMYRVRLGPYADNQTGTVLSQLRAIGLKDMAVVRH